MSEPKQPRDGGAAFPLQDSNTFTLNTGMSLRDWFAGMALQGYASNTDENCTAPEKLAEWAYADADAMLKVRDKEAE